MISTACFAIAAISLVARLALLVRLHLAGARHPIRDAVSDYGVGATRRGFEAMAIAATVGWWALALGTWFGYPTWTDRRFVTLALAIAGLTTAVMRFFPTDLVGDRPTARGVVHYALAIAQFALSYSAMGNVARLLGDRVSPVLRMVALVSLVALCVCLVPRLRVRLGLFGLFERIFLVSVACFYLNYAVLSLARAA